MSKNSGTVEIRWVRSGIAFNRKQKEIVRSLGLRRLHQVVERPDNPAVRGLVAKVAHLVEIVNGDQHRKRESVPEYTVASVEPAETVGLANEPGPAEIEAQSTGAQVEPGTVESGTNV